MSYSENIWRSHNGANQQHVFSGYSRKAKVRVPIFPNMPEGPKQEVTLIVRPRNASRWLPHVGGASCGPRVEQVTSERLVKKHADRVARRNRRMSANRMVKREAR